MKQKKEEKKVEEIEIFPEEIPEVIVDEAPASKPPFEVSESEGFDVTKPHYTLDNVKYNYTPDELIIWEQRQQEIEKAKPLSAAYLEITRLEALETDRRLAEAILTDEGKQWLTNNRALIAVQRDIITSLKK